MIIGRRMPAANIALAIWRGDEYILSFLFAIRLRFRQTNNAEQQYKQLAFVSLISSGTKQTEHRIPPHRQCFNVRQNLPAPQNPAHTVLSFSFLELFAPKFCLTATVSPILCQQTPLASLTSSTHGQANFALQSVCSMAQYGVIAPVAVKKYLRFSYLATQ